MPYSTGLHAPSTSADSMRTTNVAKKSFLSWRLYLQGTEASFAEFALAGESAGRMVSLTDVGTPAKQGILSGDPASRGKYGSHYCSEQRGHG